MIEEQALCRIHRMGQTKEVRTVRFRIKNSFEEVRTSFASMKSGKEERRGDSMKDVGFLE
jgi:SNF2 family DNA or RNA helicase